MANNYETGTNRSLLVALLIGYKMIFFSCLLNAYLNIWQGQQDSGLCPSPLKHALSKLLRVFLLRRTYDYDLRIQRISVVEPSLVTQLI